MENELIVNIVTGIFVAVFAIGFFVAFLWGIRAVIPGRRDRSRIPGWIWLLSPLLVLAGLYHPNTEARGQLAVTSDATVLAFLTIAVTLLVRTMRRSRSEHPPADGVRADPPWPPAPTYPPPRGDDASGDRTPRQPPNET